MGCMEECNRAALKERSAAVYRHLQDTESRKIFEQRLMYSLTGNEDYINNMIMGMPETQEISGIITKCQALQDRLVVYGAGLDLNILKKLFPGFRPGYICDKSEEKRRRITGAVPISPEQLTEDYGDCHVLICTTVYWRQIYEFLISQGIGKERIINIGPITEALHGRQYFEPGIMIPGSREVFVDCGCYDCGTDQAFIDWCGGNYETIYAFEPDKENYEFCLKERERSGIRDLRLIHKGVWKCETTLCFQSSRGAGSRVVDENAVGEIAVTSIDGTVGNEKVSFIKMDVEGSELMALQGAENTILRCHPRLAISLYHKPEDILDIPEYILSLWENYRLYIRHYRLAPNETVLYAV